MSIFQLYLLTRLPSIGMFFIALGAASFLASAVFTINYITTRGDKKSYHSEEPSNEHKNSRLAAIIFIPLFCVSSLIALACPTQEDIITMVVGHYATNDAEISKLPSNLASLINGWIEAAKVTEKPNGTTTDSR